LGAQHAETIAGIKGVEHASLWAMERLIVETDVVNVLNMMRDFTLCSISHCPKACNSIAHTLAEAVGLNFSNGRTMYLNMLLYCCISVSELPGQSD
ncbi:hypothetical protein BAE44_0023441, partial [Dichanthelium oligosanthes]